MSEGEKGRKIRNSELERIEGRRNDIEQREGGKGGEGGRIRKRVKEKTSRRRGHEVKVWRKNKERRSEERKRRQKTK